MTIPAIVTGGFGSFGSSSLVIMDGFAAGAEAPPAVVSAVPPHAGGYTTDGLLHALTIARQDGGKGKKETARVKAVVDRVAVEAVVEGREARMDELLAELKAEGLRYLNKQAIETRLAESAKIARRFREDDERAAEILLLS